MNIWSKLLNAHDVNSSVMMYIIGLMKSTQFLIILNHVFILLQIGRTEID
jgi:hypothetical protein